MTVQAFSNPPPPSLSNLPTRRQLWFAAFKPPMYTVAITPITVGSCAAYLDIGLFSLSTFSLLLFSAVLIILWLNLTNDVFDFDTGIDKHKRESIVNLSGATRRARNVILFLATCSLVAAFSALFRISSNPSDLTVVFILLLAVFGGYAYQGPPFRLGYYGLGEPICFLTWLLGVVAAYYSQLRHHQYAPISNEDTLFYRLSFLFFNRLLSPNHSLLPAALLVPIPTFLILLCSHFHQIKDDKAAGKRSPVVRLGTERVAALVQYIIIAFWLLHLYFWRLRIVPSPVFFLSILSLPLSLHLVRFVNRFHGNTQVIRVAKYHAVKFHFAHGMAVTLGYILEARIRYI